MTKRVYLSLGSNLGDRLGHLRSAVNQLRSRMSVASISSVYETQPVGVVDQPPFLNIVLGADTPLEPLPLLHLLKEIEKRVGRRPTYRWGPRVVDIDILLLDGCVEAGPELEIPHRSMAERAFVLIPLAEVAGDAIHPVLHVPVRELTASVGGKEDVRRTGAFDPVNSTPDGAPGP